ncbi:MAG TPA: class I SAM-dependent methyltransferase [bacterium]|nr:class I SAM-dependent methyltransferase [bacterium]
MIGRGGSMDEKLEQIKEYWNQRIHDMEMTEHALGTLGFFNDLEAYRYEKLNYLPGVVNFESFSGKKVLEIGCGIGTDLVRFARGGAIVTGVDLSETAVDLAVKNFRLHNLEADLRVGNGESLEFPDNTFDAVYAHGVLQYTADITRMIHESFRVLKSGGVFIGMLYNRKGWLNAMSSLFKVDLEHDDAPVFNLYTQQEFKKFLGLFHEVSIVPERFPVKSRLQKGWKAFFFNTVFVGFFNLIPRAWVRQWGWHLMGFGVKNDA